MAKRKRYAEVMLLAAGEVVPGHQIHYVIERMVGLGAYGAVYAARDPETPGRQIALKEFFPARHPRDQAPLQAVFDRERAVGMQASPHPLMPTFYEAFLNDGHYYIAQEFIVGATLDEIILRRHPLPRDWILKWSVSLCDALAFLHARQIVHHDLKPANIRITPQGHLVLLDFGAAQYFGKGHESAAPAELYGTEGYLPPELEADGQWIADIRTDIFALGCVLYEMIAGTPPDQEQINARSMYVTNTLIQRPNADLGLVKLINKAISYNTDYRYATAGDFLNEMRAVAPPVLLVNRKHLRFGEVSRGHTAPPMTVTLYNAGGGQISGEIKPRAPWIRAAQQRFTGNHVEVAVLVDPSKTSERNTLVTGKLEVSSDDQRDAEGGVISGDKWAVECSMIVLPIQGQLTVTEQTAPNSPAILLTGRKGQTLHGEFHLQNLGETTVEFQITQSADKSIGAAAKPPLGVEITPPEGSLEGSQSLPVTLTVSTADLPAGEYPAALTVRTQTRQSLTIPLAVHVLSPLGYVFAKMGGHA